VDCRGIRDPISFADVIANDPRGIARVGTCHPYCIKQTTIGTEADAIAYGWARAGRAAVKAVRT
jgi:hypothetical protein